MGRRRRPWPIHRLAVRGLVLAAAAAPLALPARAMPDPDRAAAGRALALRLCTPCHMVSARDASQPILRQRTPSLEEIARRPGMTMDAIRNFLLTTHAAASGPMRMPDPMLEEAQADDIAAYVASLKPATRPAR